MSCNAATGRPKEECGVCGIFGHPDAAKLTYFGLYALQHRGQESAGIVVTDGDKVLEHKAMGLVPEVFSESTLSRLQGDMAIGHVRYSTTGGSNIINAQPFTASHRGNSISIAHNGNLVNTRALRDELEANGAIFQSSTDSEVVVHLLAHNSGLTRCSRKMDRPSRITVASFSVSPATSLLNFTTSMTGCCRPACRPAGSWADQT